MCARFSFLTCLVLISSLVLCSEAEAGGLIGWWKLDDGSGTIAKDSSGLGNDGILGPEGNPTWVAGKIGGAINLDGNDDYVNINAVADDLTANNFSISAWMKTTMTGDGNVIGANDTGSGHDFIFGVDQGVLLVEADSIRRYPPTINDGQWHMITYVRDGSTAYAYTDGVLVGTETPSGNPAGQARWSIGQEWDSSPSDEFEGQVDDVRFYDRPLPADMVAGLFSGIEPAFVKAEKPVPADGATYTDTWVSLGWTPGDRAVTHDVYFSDNLDDVTGGASAAFRSNEPTPFYLAGLGLPGDPYPAGLVPGTTYYWRIDEVEADGTTKHQGDVWSFFIPSRKAYASVPADGGVFVDTAPTLSWSGGLNAKLHYVYFGETFDDVNNATQGGMPVAVTRFTPPGTLAMEKTYYWRVDEFDGAATHKGDVWSFTTTIPGLGNAVAMRWNNISGTDLNTLKSDPRYPNNPDVTETVTEFAWDGPDTDNYGGRIEGWLYVPATGDYTFWLATDDQGELWLSNDDDSSNVRLIAYVKDSPTATGGWAALNEFTKYPSQKSASISLVGGEKYYIMAIWKEGGGGDHCQVAWQGPGIPTRTIIPGANLSPYKPLNAYGARPANGATGVSQTPTLRWKPGLQAASSEVYFGTDADAVKNATKASPEYKGVRALGSETYSPGTLGWLTPYYWRVDEVNNANPASPWVGRVWSFTTADFIIIDDIESYNDLPETDPGSNRIYTKWIDGFGTTTNGALVGNLDVPLTERSNTHSGDQAMPLSYDNNLKFSEATLTLAVADRDWTRGGVANLAVWFRGLAANAAERMYVVLNGTAVVYHTDPAATQIATWTEWVIPLQQFADLGVNPANVTSITIGFGTRGNTTTAGGAGQMYFDDIRLTK